MSKIRTYITLLATIVFIGLTHRGARAIDDYQLGPDSMRQDGVPRGKVSEHDWNESKVYPGTQHTYWVYVPAQYDPAVPASLMVFQDG